MDYYTRSAICIFSFLLCVLAGTYRAHRMDKAGKVLVLYALSFLLTELSATFAGLIIKSNLEVYAVGTVMEFVLLMLYFNESVPSIRQKQIGIFLAIGGGGFGIVNNFFIQPPDAIPNHFLTVGALVTILLSLISLVGAIYHQPYNQILRRPWFWVSVVFLSYWTITYFLWTLLAFAKVETGAFPNGLLVAVCLMNMFSGLSLAIIFFNYPKMMSHAT